MSTLILMRIISHCAGAALLLVCWLAGTATAGAQVLVTGETGGAGGQAVVLAGNLLSVKEFTNLGNFWAQFAYGVSDRVDVFASYGNTEVYDKIQHYVGVGSNISVLRRAQNGLDLSFFNTASVALTRRDEACTLFVTLAAVASHPVTLGSVVITPYGGFNSVVPIGQRAQGLFTPLETLHTGIAGVAIPFHKTWQAYIEYDPGPKLRAAGVGLVYIVPRPAKP